MVHCPSQTVRLPEGSSTEHITPQAQVAGSDTLPAPGPSERRGRAAGVQENPGWAAAGAGCVQLASG